MTYDKQDLLLDLRKLAASIVDGTDPEAAHAVAVEALVRFIDDEQISAAYKVLNVAKWSS